MLENKLVPDDNADSDAWRIPVSERLFHECIKAGELLIDVDRESGCPCAGSGVDEKTKSSATAMALISLPLSGFMN